MNVINTEIYDENFKHFNTSPNKAEKEDISLNFRYNPKFSLVHT
jgi:hypothetical protein